MGERVGPPAARADARRNRALVLRAAREAFEESGSGTSLGEIARRAGVGAGTVYRHFASKEALFRATVEDRIRLFTGTAQELADSPNPGQVFYRYLSAVVRLASRNRALSEALEEAGRNGPASARPVEAAFGAALEVLLRRAQEVGAVRSDVSLGDVWMMLAGCLVMERGPGRSARSAGDAVGAERSEGDPVPVPGRMALLVWDALRPGRHVTKLPLRRSKRGETSCAVCSEPIDASSTGRPARFCGAACRQRAYRARLRSG